MQNAETLKNIIKNLKKSFKSRDGHKYIPYLVLIIDEFADLIMTTGKRLKQT